MATITKPSSQYLIGGANIDANYGPWDSIDAYLAWLEDTIGLSQPNDGTLIVVKNGANRDMMIYSNGTWGKVGSLADGSITLTKLATEVKTAIENAGKIASVTADCYIEERAGDFINIDFGVKAKDKDNNVVSSSYDSLELPAASVDGAGLMTTSMTQTLGKLETDATVDVEVIPNASDVKVKRKVVHGSAKEFSLPAATPEHAGVMSSEQVKRLENSMSIINLNEQKDEVITTDVFVPVADIGFGKAIQSKINSLFPISGGAIRIDEYLEGYYSVMQMQGVGYALLGYVVDVEEPMIVDVNLQPVDRFVTTDSETSSWTARKWVEECKKLFLVNAVDIEALNERVSNAESTLNQQAFTLQRLHEDKANKTAIEEIKRQVESSAKVDDIIAIMQSLPSSEAVSAQVAINTSKINDFFGTDSTTSLEEKFAVEKNVAINTNVSIALEAKTTYRVSLISLGGRIKNLTVYLYDSNGSNIANFKLATMDSTYEVNLEKAVASVKLSSNQYAIENSGEITIVFSSGGATEGRIGEIEASINSNLEEIQSIKSQLNNADWKVGDIDFTVMSLRADSVHDFDAASTSRVQDLYTWTDNLYHAFTSKLPNKSKCSRTQIGTSSTPIDAQFPTASGGTYSWRGATIDANTYPLYSYVYKFVAAPTKKIIIMGGIHGPNTNGGDGINGVISAAYFMRNLLFNPRRDGFYEYIKSNCEIIYIPLINPWGYQNGYRCNGRYVDMNRNWDYNWSSEITQYGFSSGASALSENETSAIASYISENHLDADFALEIHSRGDVPTNDLRFLIVSHADNTIINSAMSEVCAEAVNRYGGQYKIQDGDEYSSHPSCCNYITKVLNIPCYEPEFSRTLDIDVSTLDCQPLMIQSVDWLSMQIKKLVDVFYLQE